jgi:WD40 repeat protein
MERERGGGSPPRLAREAHLFPGKFVRVSLAISPDLKWVASASEDNTLRLWPVPDLAQPPLHTLARDELLTKLRSFTNLRAARDGARGPIVALA